MSRCRFGSFEFDHVSGELRRDGQIVRLAPQPTRVLTVLLERPGELIPREELRKRIWDDNTFVDFERGLNFCIVQVRGALGDVSDNPRFVQTVPRKGYRFIAPVQVTVDVVPPPIPDEPATRSGAMVAIDDPPAVWASPRRWALAAAALAIGALVAGLAVGGRLASVRGTGARPDPVRLAVLPFLNLTGDPTLDYLADGLTDEVIAQLGLLSRDRLAVIARTSAMSYRHSSKPAAQIGYELDVTYLVESSVRRHGDALRLASNLIRVSNESSESSWSETFDPPSSPGTLQHTRAAVRLARLIALELAPGGMPDRAGPTTMDGMAWDAFLKGKALTNAGGAADIRQALALFDTAVRRDPTFAGAWAKVAETRHLLVMMGALAPRDAYAAAAVAAERAIQSDPNLADAYLAQGIVQLWYDWHPAEAARSFEKALSLNPSHAAAHHDYAWSLVALGRSDDAVRHITTARALDPLSTRANADVGWLYLQLGEPDQATRACEQTLAIQPGSLDAQACLERAYVQRESLDVALDAARATLPASRGAALTHEGSAEEALRAIWRWRLDQLEQASRDRWTSPYTMAVLQASLGDLESAMASLEGAYDHRDGMMVLLERDPALAAVRRHPRVQALVQRIAQRDLTTAPR